jgi:hypothetical protein
MAWQKENLISSLIAEASINQFVYFFTFFFNHVVALRIHVAFTKMLAMYLS